MASNTAVNGWRAVNSAVRVNNNVSRYVVVNFNADAGVDSLAEIRLGYRVDAGPVQIRRCAELREPHRVLADPAQHGRHLAIPAGTHTIRPYWRISGAAGKNGVIASRCLTAEAYTS